MQAVVQPTEVIEKISEPAGEEPEEPVAQGADSRVPPEARRMSASPYGAMNSAAVRRPGTRPVQAVRRPPQEPRRAPEVRRPVRPAGGSPGQAGGNSGVSVGYAPGRMNMNPRTAQEYVRDIRNAQEYGREPSERDVYSGRDAYSREPRDPRRIGVMPEAKFGSRMAADEPPRPPKSHKLSRILAAVLLVIGLLLTALLCLPKDNGLRKAAENAAKGVAGPVEDLVNRKNREPLRIIAFSVTGNDKVTAPADVIFSVTTESKAGSLRLVDEESREVPVQTTRVENSDNDLWTFTMRVKSGYEGEVQLQAKRDGQDWVETDYSATLAIAPPLNMPDGDPEEEGEIPPAEDGTPEGGAEDIPPAAPEEDPEEDGEAIPPATPEEDEPEDESGEAPDETPEEDPDETPEEEPGEEAEKQPEEGLAAAADTAADADGETPEPTQTPAPLLTAQADPSADPSLIQTTIVYDGSKKVKQYTRAAKSMIHMPAGDDYTPQKIGVLTFRGNAFRQNASVGIVGKAAELQEVWHVEAGSAKGAGQVYYGYEWTGQPAIMKWSTQVREASNIDEEKRSKTALREVIIAGVDGVIRFLDIDDGVVTRSAINLGYPMKGTPSLHPAGFPYMNVGQYTRKMKSKTGKIGIRQYNLYNQKELKLIDGLDGKLHRGIYKFGSFETSSLIDRTSDTAISIGTSGLLYLTSLNTEFDYKAATLKITPGSIVMSARAKGEKKDERVAVESSHAMYDKYVFYADMGGILRCVDTNYLAPVWAVETGDSVMAAIALDQPDMDTLDLYTANMLSLRKSGPAQIRKYNALSGKELWTVEIGVAKNTKTKEDVGVKASPVIGQKGLKDLVYFTVTGLSKDGCATLDVPEDTKAALVALEKETGKVRWASPLGDRSESSPVAVYDAEGNGWIIQCVENGTILLLDGLTGRTLNTLSVDGKIKASPAVYNDIMVVGTTGKGTEFVYGIRIR